MACIAFCQAVCRVAGQIDGCHCRCIVPAGFRDRHSFCDTAANGWRQHTWFVRVRRMPVYESVELVSCDEGQYAVYIRTQRRRDDGRNTKTGDIELASVRYEDTAVDEDEFDLITVLPSALLPDISKYRDCRRRAVINFENGLKYNFYTMDGEAWLVRLGNEKIGIWSIYRLKKVK